MAEPAWIGWLRDAQERLEALDGILDRARDSAEADHDEVRAIQEAVRRANHSAVSLLQRVAGR